MRMHDMFDRVESADIAFELGSVASRERFDSAALRHAWVRELIDAGLKDTMIQEGIAGRLRELCNAESDHRYQNPQDVAIAIYLRILDLASPLLAEALAPIVQRVPNAWWSRVLAKRLSEPFSRTLESADQSTRESIRGLSREMPITRTIETGEILAAPKVEGTLKLVEHRKRSSSHQTYKRLHFANESRHHTDVIPNSSGSNI